jgi:protein TonB
MLHALLIAWALTLSVTMIPAQNPPPLETTLLPLPEPPPPEEQNVRIEPVRPHETTEAHVQPVPVIAAQSAPAPAAPEVPTPTLAPSAPAAPRSGADGNGTHGNGDHGTGEGRNGPGSAGAGGTADGENLARPQWIERLTIAQMLPYFPPYAVQFRTSGNATLACQVNAQNHARNCRILGETPRTTGFGQAAIRMSHLFRIRPPERDGVPQYETWVRIHIVFDTP